MVAECPLSFVRKSGVRTAVLESITESPASTRTLVGRLEASESAVYEAVDDLSGRGIIRDAGGVWEPTGAGIVVLDLLARQRETTDVLEAAPEYWERHATDVLPREYRERLGMLDGFEVIRGTGTDPTRAVREKARHIEQSERVDVLANVHQSQLSPAVRETDADMRYVLDRSLVEEFLSDPPDDLAAAEEDVRVADVAFALILTERSLILSLPLCTGEYDPSSALVASGPSALAWGRELFDSYWVGAEPLEGLLEAGTWPDG